jgi:hypothetical protein
MFISMLVGYLLKPPGPLKLLQYLCSYPLHTPKAIFKKIKEHANAVLPVPLLLFLKSSLATKPCQR